MTTKYRNTPVAVDGEAFDSKAEARRYQELRLLEQAGAILDLERQPAYELLPAFRDARGTWHRAIVYRADFEYMEDGKRIAEDVKGAPETQVFRIKRKLFAHRYPDIELRVVT